MIEIGENLSKKITFEILRFPGRIPILTYFFNSYYIENNEKKVQTGDGFILSYVEDKSLLVEDISGMTTYVELKLKNGDICIARLPIDILNKKLKIDIIGEKILLIDNQI